MKLFINNTDISEDVVIKSAVHEMYAEKESDKVILSFENVKDWNAWQPTFRDKLILQDAPATTGEMNICEITSTNGYGLIAKSTPQSGYIKRNRTWENVYLSQIIKDIARNNDLKLSRLFDDDFYYAYVNQNNMSDLQFLQRQLMLEGMAFLINNNTLIIYKESDLEGQPASSTIMITETVDYGLNQKEEHGSCTLEAGEYRDTFRLSDGKNLYIQNVSAGSHEEATRYAKNLLRYKNKYALSGYIKYPYTPELAAGSMINIQFDNMSSFNGPMFIYHIRHDYIKEKSKIFFRQILGGY